jgi:hypothetical protein
LSGRAHWRECYAAIVEGSTNDGSNGEGCQKVSRHCFLELASWWSKRASPQQPQAAESTSPEFRILVVRPVYLLTSSGSLGLLCNSLNSTLGSADKSEVVGRRVHSGSEFPVTASAAVSTPLEFRGLLARRGNLCRLKRDNFPVAILFYPNPSVANVAAEWFPVDRRLYRI